jgi:hypothetical protein
MPWIPLSTSEYSIKQVNDEETPFIVSEKESSLQPPFYGLKFFETDFIDFVIKKDGPHMKEERYGIIDIGTPMYDISVKMSEEQIEKIYQQYK